MRKNFGMVLKESREAHDLSRDQLAKKLRISTHYVGHLENENPAAPVSIKLLNKIQSVLGLRKGAERLAELHNARVRRYLKARKTS